jgi:hypothetical protein
MTDMGLSPLSWFLIGAVFTGAISYFIHKRFLSRQLEGLAAIEADLAGNKIALRKKTQESSEELSLATRRHAKEIEELVSDYHLKLEGLRSDYGIKQESQVAKAYQEGFEKCRLIEEEKGKVFSVGVRPYVGKFIRKGFVKHTTKVYIGYQYQLLVRGIPCFEPHKVYEQELEEVVFDDEKLNKCIDKAIEIAEAAVRLSAGPAAQLISVSRLPVIERLKSERVASA